MSHHGTFRTSRDVRLESGMHSKADARPTMRIQGITVTVHYSALKSTRMLSRNPPSADVVVAYADAKSLYGYGAARLGLHLGSLRGKRLEGWAQRLDSRPSFETPRCAGLLRMRSEKARSPCKRNLATRLRQNNPTGRFPLSSSGKSLLKLPASCPRGRGVGHRHERRDGMRWTRRRRARDGMAGRALRACERSSGRADERCRSVR
jgi:hypothetical protein